jgi:hypothetical protein
LEAMSYVNEVAIREAREELEDMLLYLKGLEAQLVSCILDNWDKVADKIDEALLRHDWPTATIPVRCEEIGKRLVVFLKFRHEEEEEWHFVGARLASRGGFPYKWDIVVEESGKVVLVENKREVTPIARP